MYRRTALFVEKFGEQGCSPVRMNHFHHAAKAATTNLIVIVFWVSMAFVVFVPFDDFLKKLKAFS